MALAQYSLEDTIPIKEIIIMSNRFQQYQLAGGTTERIDSVILMDKLTGTLADVLTENTPVFIKSYGKSSIATASIRGTGASHTVVLWNGLPLNSPLTGQVDFSLIPVYFTDEVNIFFGTAAIQNTGGALGGSITLENSPDWTKGVSGKLVQEAGSFNSFTGFGKIHWAGNNLMVQTRVFSEYSNNNFTYYNDVVPKEEQGYVKQKDAQYQRKGILQELSYRNSEKSVITVDYWYQDGNREIPLLMNNSATGHDENQWDQSNKLVGSYKHYGRWVQYEFSSGLLADKLDYYLKYKPLGTDEYNTNIDSKSNSISSITRLKMRSQWGNNWKADLSLSSGFYSVKTFDAKSLEGYSGQRNQFSVFGSIHKGIGARGLISAMLRAERSDNKNLPVIPAFGTEWILVKSIGLRIQGNLSRNYHQPSLNDLYYLPGGNRELKPEEGFTSEMGLSSTIVLKGLTVKSTVNSYYSEIKNWILWKPSPFGYWSPENIRQVRSKGLEINSQVEDSWGPFGFKIRVQYAFSPTTNETDPLDMSNQSKGKQLIYIPVHSGSGLFNFTFRGYELNWITWIVGERQTTSNSDDLYPPLPLYALTNISVGKSFQWGRYALNIKGKVGNLFNKSYTSIQYRAMPGRNYSLFVQFSF